MEIGDQMPKFKLPCTSGGICSSEDLKGKKVVLYFYPKDDTPGCTKEACSFSSLKKQFEKLGAVILGVSKDPLSKHEKFIEKYGLSFDLIADEELELIKAADAWKEKKMYGKSFMGIQRCTYIFDEKGILQMIWPKVKVVGHAEEVLQAVKNL